MANKAAKGIRSKTRHSFKGQKLTVEKLLQEFNVGDKVVIKANGTYHSGLPDKRSVGQVAEVLGKVGRTTYRVSVKKSGKEYLIGNTHLKQLVVKWLERKYYVKHQ